MERGRTNKVKENFNMESPFQYNDKPEQEEYFNIRN